MLFIVLLQSLCVHRYNKSLVLQCMVDLTYVRGDDTCIRCREERRVERVGPRDASETEKVSSQRH